MFGTPNVGHEEILVIAEGKDEGALSTERLVGIRADAGVGVLRPRSPNA